MVVVAALAGAPEAIATPDDINTFAGTGTGGFSGDGGPATSAQLQNPGGVAVDASGSLYVADALNHRVRKVDGSGTITTVAGTGIGGFSGDGGQATSAELNYPYGVAIDSDGNLYIGDTYNGRVRKVDGSGTITTVAGTGAFGFSGDGGAATSAELYYPYGVAVDGSGTLYIADSGNSAVRRVDGSGTITTIAGTGTAGFSGDGGQATSAELDGPHGVVPDDSGNLYVADAGNNRVRRVDGSGTITTIAGTGTAGFSGDGGQATSADLNLTQGTGLAVDGSANLYVADTLNNRVRKIDGSGTITTVAGTGAEGFSGDGGPAASAELNYPLAVAADSSRNLYIADFWNHRVRKVEGPDTVPPTTTISGPSGTSNDPTPTFIFSSEPGSTFECKLDSGSYAACSSPFTSPHLADGPHNLTLRATDPADNLGPEASQTFTVDTATVSVSSSTLTVTAATGAKENVQITKPSASTLRVTDLASGFYTGSGVHAGAGCTRSGDYTANCNASGITLIKVTAGDQTDKVVNSTAVNGSLNGGTANDILTGGSAQDTLTGAAGVDVMKGMSGNDQLMAHDGASDTTIDCDGGAADKADLDLLPKDPNTAVSGCETKTRH
jgi:hypothetical protein